MSREKFEADVLAAKRKLQDDYIDEVKAMDKERDQLKTEIPAGISAVEEKKKRLAEIEGKPAETEAQEQKELFKTWRTVELGTGLKTAKDFENALKKAEREISDDARKLLKEVEKEIAAGDTYEKREIKLVNATPAELGLPEGGTLEQIYVAAEKKGLEKCPAEAGPQSAIQYEDQPKGEYRLIGMDPVTGSGGYRHAFSMDRNVDGGRWLYTNDGGPGRVWSPDDRFVFVRRKSELKT